ncbi:MAG: hypothetical protein PUK09_05875 [Bacilli bacterium]|nr:hypothetical protein [Bacilli bacterium]
MNRLTKYEPNGESMFPYKLKDEELSTKLDSIHKLGLLEDVEEEIGIYLITLFKALNKGFYIKYNDKIVHIHPDKHITINFWYNTINVYIPPKFFIDCKKGTDYLSEEIDEEYWFKDYGKTWALTKEELENENTR